MLAVVHARAKDPLINEAKQREDAEIFTITFVNREGLHQQLSKQALSVLSLAKSSRF